MAEGDPTPAPVGPMDPKLLELFQNIASNPTEVVAGQFRGYLEDFIRITMGTQKNWSPPVGSPLTVFEDLTAETGEYVYTDVFGISYLYANGAAVSQTDYADLYAAWGANKWGADSGGNFLLPDSRGRALFYCGTHANAGVGDNDGAAVADRQAKHVHTDSLEMTSHTHSGASLAISPDPHSHAGVVTTGSSYTVDAGATNGVVDDLTVASTATTSLSITGSTGAQSNSGIDGTVGTGTTGDAPAHLFIGSLLIRF